MTRNTKNTNYLFAWDIFVKKDRDRLEEFLTHEFDIDWVKEARIEKEGDGKTIRIFTEKNSLLLKLNDKQNKVNLEIDDGRTYEFVANMENGHLCIYHSLYQMKIMVMLYKLQVLGNRRIGDVFSGGQQTADKYLRELEDIGFARIQSRKPFRDKEANLWELTESGRAFIEEQYRSGKAPKIKISDMNQKLSAVCSEVMKLLEKPLSFDELITALNASGIKIRKYKLGDVLKILEAAGQVIKVPGVKVPEQGGVARMSSVPGGVVVFMKTEGADIESAAL